MPGSTRIQPSAVYIAGVTPDLDCATTPMKRTVGETVTVSAEIVAARPLVVRAVVRYRPIAHRDWERVAMTPDASDIDRHRGEFRVDALGRWQYEIEAWVDHAATWRSELQARLDAGEADLEAGLKDANRRFETSFSTVHEALTNTLEVRQGVVRSPAYLIDVDPEIARFGAWYELFPRSFGGFRGVRDQLPRLAELGFDVLYLPPIHPIGRTNRKGRNNALVAGPDDPGSPWAVGDATGGHTAIHRDLGTIDEFDELVADARAHRIEIALDLALQCSVDHPWLTERPEWFAWRDDGTVRFAENPPKRYEDIVNLDFDTEQWWTLWNTLLSVIRFWVEHGVRAFRVDNPHTKPIRFWEWLIGEVRSSHPEVVFLAEAFTRPAIMRALAKVGFNQSYTYFTWRNTREELTSYLEELAGTMHEYFRPNFFVNTPDILAPYLQSGGPAAFAARAVLAATLAPAYGVYSGFESFENRAIREGSEEYLDSEKYEIKRRRLDGPLLELLARLNGIRRSSSVFRHVENVRFLPTANDLLIAFEKRAEANGHVDELFVVCVNLDAHHEAQGLVEIPADLGLPGQFTVTDLLHDVSFRWSVGGNYVHLEAGDSHILRIR